MPPNDMPSPAPTVGDPAPPLTLVDAGGEPWELARRDGRIVVLIFHRHIH